MVADALFSMECLRCFLVAIVSMIKIPHNMRLMEINEKMWLVVLLTAEKEKKELHKVQNLKLAYK